MILCFVLLGSQNFFLLLTIEDIVKNTNTLIEIKFELKFEMFLLIIAILIGIFVKLRS